MHEPDVALTDFALALETLAFACSLARMSGDRSWRRLGAILFLAFSLSSLLGGVYHGFFPLRTGTPGGRFLWLGTMFCFGASGLLLWQLGSGLLRRPWREGIRWLSLGAFLLYVPYVAFEDHRFVVAIAFTLPPLVFLLVLYFRHRDEPGSRAGGASVLVTLLASVLQQAHVGIPPLRLSHNAVYHVIQAGALWLLFRSVKAFAGGATNRRGGHGRYGGDVWVPAASSDKGTWLPVNGKPGQ